MLEASSELARSTGLKASPGTRRGRAIALVLLVVGLIVFGVTNPLKLNPFPFQAIAFDGGSTITGGTFYSCNSAWFTPGFSLNLPTLYPCTSSSSSSTSSPSPANCAGLNACRNLSAIGSPGTTTQGFTIAPLIIGVDSNDNPNPNPLGGTFPTSNCRSGAFNLGGPSYNGGCAHVSVYLASKITGNVQFPYNKIDSNFQSLYGTPAPPCNPCNIGQNNTSVFWVTAYGGDIRLTRQDVITPTYQCFNRMGVLGATIGQCTGAETDALNSGVLSFINANDNIAGTILVDLTIPGTLPLTSRDNIGIFAAYTAQGSSAAANGCIFGNSGPKTYIINVQQCSSNTLIPITNLGFTPYSNTYTPPNTFAAGQISPSLVSSLRSTVQLAITIGNIQPQYSGSCGASCYGDTAPTISGDSTLTVDIPFIFEVLDVTPIVCQGGQTLVNGNCQTAPTCTSGQTFVKNATYPQGICTTIPTSCTGGICTAPCTGGYVLVNGICVPPTSCPTGYSFSMGQCLSTQNNGLCGFSSAYNVSGIGCPKLTNPNGNLIVHVASALFNIPLSGVQVGVNPSSLGSCSASSSFATTTDANGNALFVNLSPANGGNYLACAQGSTGTAQLFFIGIGVNFVPATTSCLPVYSAGTTTCSLPLQSNVDLYFTTFTVGLILLGILVLVVLVVLGRGRAAKTVVTFGSQTARKAYSRNARKK